MHVPQMGKKSLASLACNTLITHQWFLLSVHETLKQHSSQYALQFNGKIGCDIQIKCIFISDNQCQF